MKNTILKKSLFSCVVCALALMSLASCSQAPDFEPALPDTETRATQPDSIWFEFYNLPEPLYPCQRITFRIFSNGDRMYTADEFNMRVYNPETGKTLPVTYEAPYYMYHFFTGSERHYVLEVSLASDPSVTASKVFSVERGIYLKLAFEDRWKYEVQPVEGTVFLESHAIHFYTDESCTTRIMSLPRPVTVRVHLVKKAIELFSPTTAHLYRDVDVHVAEGSSETCSQRLITTHQTLPSGEQLDDYYEIELLKVH